MAERGERQDKDHHEHRGNRQEDEGRERETADLRARLGHLSDALDSNHGDVRKVSEESRQGAPGESPASIGDAMGLAFRVMSEFVTAVIVGAVIGWLIDHFAGTSPAFIIVFLLMGAAAGFWNVYRIAMQPPAARGR